MDYGPPIEAKIQFQRAGLGLDFLPGILIENYLNDGSLIQLAAEEPDGWPEPNKI